METFKMAHDIISLPEKFYKDGSSSMYYLLKECGYFKYYNRISENDILNALKQHPESVDYWINWSENKRNVSGWYFIQKNNGIYVVGHVPDQENFQTKQYVNKIEACADFIKREIESIRMC